MSLLLPPASALLAAKLAPGQPDSNRSTPMPGTPSLLTSAPSSVACDNLSTPGNISVLSTPQLQFSSVTSPHATPLGTPITSDLNPEALRQHRQFLQHQRTQVLAFEHELLHKFILNHTNRIQSVSRSDHKAMVKILIAEAYRNDPHRRANRARWERVHRDAMREIDSRNTVLMSVAPDPYHGSLAKLSSMLMWNTGVQYWSYRYWEEEMLRRRSVQQSTLNQLRGKGLFLQNPAIPTPNKFA
eukprot:GILI01007745.1.p1 GENE.GILI01007745.1~~GILI01007745.1.p1  ORF type:complete len:243 (-),score=29.30 GILI01007745.1:582-1310(-)